MSVRMPGPQTAARMSEIAGVLAGAGLDARVHDTRGVLDVTATLGQPGGRSVEVIVDDDGYTQVSYWNSPGAAPAQVTAIITAVIAVITEPAGQRARAAGSAVR
jgi:hypothetical protein